ncbi:MAG: hypothetical protein JWP02_522 [Acidimicrobiales bacterium]|nr:hypothetical protein [Acidimicrobiales bacterium]
MGNKFMRGALVEFMPVFGFPIPNVIIFQFNPETMTHAWTQAEAAPASAGTAKPNPLAVKGMPGESFTFTLVMDASESIADSDPVSGPIAEVSGVYTRLAALEMLQYPVASDPTAGLAGAASAAAGPAGAAVSGALGGGAAPARPIPDSQVPTVLFVWGPGRIVPVRVTALSITEKLYDAFLSPTHAEANVTVRVLTPDELEFVTGPLSDIAKGAYTYSQGLRTALALANLANAAESIVGMLPF